MEETNHTEGPWKATGLSKNGNYFRVRGTILGKKFRIADCPFVGDSFLNEKAEAEANSCLMAASPDLLSALRDSLYIGDDELLKAAIREKARAAIAKATQPQE